MIAAQARGGYLASLEESTCASSPACDHPCDVAAREAHGEAGCADTVTAPDQERRRFCVLGE